jgi:hypothetical protein
MNRGYIRLQRQSLDDGMIKNHKLWVCWCWLQLKATFKQTTVYIGYHKIYLKPGQLIVGRKKLAAELGMSESSVRRCLDSLEGAGEINREVTTHCTVITICNWKTSQRNISETDHDVTTETTTYRPHTGHIQEGKKGKEIKNEKALCDSADAKPHDNNFDSFWRAYPGQKRDKKKCRDMWKRRNFDRHIDEILAGIKREQNWRDDAGPIDFRPEWKHPHTWLNGECWNDELVTTTVDVSGEVTERPKKRFPDEDAYRAHCLKNLAVANETFDKQVKEPLREVYFRSWPYCIGPLFVVAVTKDTATLYHNCPMLIENYIGRISELAKKKIEITDHVPDEFIM